jgi:Fic family protein
LVEHWGLLNSPLLYLSVAFKRHREEYYRRLSNVRTDGDWEGWMMFFLECVRESTDDATGAAQRLFRVLATDRQALTAAAVTTVPAMRLFELLPTHPIITTVAAAGLLHVSIPTTAKALEVLRTVGILHETTGMQRDRVYAYQGYLQVLTQDTE